MKGISSVFIGAVVFSVSVSVLYAKGLAKGVGPYGELWKLIPTQRYWAPDYFYTLSKEPKGGL
jgi:hydroxylamine dehydrogenase